MSFFRKIGMNIAPAFRSLPTNLNIFGRKLTNTANQISSGVSQAQDAVNKINSVLPNPITKTINTALSGVKNISDSAGLGGQSIRALSSGNFGQAGNLADQAVLKGGEGVAQVGVGLAPLAIV